MATIRRASVTLTHDEAQTLCGILTAVASYNFDHARRTKSPAIRAIAYADGEQARDLEAAIVRRMFITTETTK